MTQQKELAKSFDPKDIEARWYPEWENSGYFKAGLDASGKLIAFRDFVASVACPSANDGSDVTASCRRLIAWARFGAKVQRLLSFGLWRNRSCLFRCT